MIKVTRVYGKGDRERVEIRTQTFWEGGVNPGMIHLRSPQFDEDSLNHIYKGIAYPDAEGYLVLEAI